MELINFNGLTCYSNSMVSIAHAYGINYASAFGELWPETDFYYQPDRKVYLSKRLPVAFEKCGLKLIMQLCGSPQQAEEILSALEEGEPIVLGMDAYHVPWCPFYGLFHGPHFFAAHYTKGDFFPCFDPTYNKAGVVVARSEIIAHAYDISRMLPIAQVPDQFEPLDGAREMPAALLELRRTLLEPIRDRIDDKQSRFLLLAKYTDALICNRYLYRYYLGQLSFARDAAHMFMNDEYFAKWAAVKNGFNKIAVITGKEAVSAEISNLLFGLFDEEIVIAKRILGNP